MCLLNSDLLSFYKEDLAGECVNRISLLASAQDVSKLKIVEDLSRESAEADATVMNFLEEGDADPLEAYRKFRAGYIGFHASLPRYRLAELI